MDHLDLPPDGRTARRHRTRGAIVQAVIELLEEDVLTPTRARIAERAGVSLRSINVHFEDRDALLVAVARQRVGQLLEGAVRVPRTGPLDDRLDAFVVQRAAILESLTPLRRASMLYEPSSAALRAQTRDATALARAEVARVFAPEVGVGSRRDHELLTALHAAAGWYAWFGLRQSGLAEPDARRVLRRTLAALLETSGAASSGGGP